MKEPLLRISQIWRTFEAQSPIKYIRYALPERTTGQRPVGAKSVFNFYQPNYTPKGAIEDAARSAEFGDPDPLYTSSFKLPMKLNLDTEIALADDVDALLDNYNLRLFGGLMSDGLREAVITHTNNLILDGSPSERRKTIAEEALLMLIVSPEFSVQR